LALAVRAYRAEALRVQVADWQNVQAVSYYLAALEGLHGQNDEVQPWIEWNRGDIARTDHLREPPVLPEKEEISPEELKPFLDGLKSIWSPSQ
jgi:hypothetical protein